MKKHRFKKQNNITPQFRSQSTKHKTATESHRQLDAIGSAKLKQEAKTIFQQLKSLTNLASTVLPQGLSSEDNNLGKNATNSISFSGQQGFQQTHNNNMNIQLQSLRLNPEKSIKNSHKKINVYQNDENAHNRSSEQLCHIDSSIRLLLKKNKLKPRNINRHSNFIDEQQQSEKLKKNPFYKIQKSRYRSISNRKNKDNESENQEKEQKKISSNRDFNNLEPGVQTSSTKPENHHQRHKSLLTTNTSHWYYSSKRFYQGGKSGTDNKSVAYSKNHHTIPTYENDPEETNAANRLSELIEKNRQKLKLSPSEEDEEEPKQFICVRKKPSLYLKSLKNTRAQMYNRDHRQHIKTEGNESKLSNQQWSKQESDEEEIPMDCDMNRIEEKSGESSPAKIREKSLTVKYNEIKDYFEKKYMCNHRE